MTQLFEADGTAAWDGAQGGAVHHREGEEPSITTATYGPTVAARDGRGAKASKRENKPTQGHSRSGGVPPTSSASRAESFRLAASVEWPAEKNPQVNVFLFSSGERVDVIRDEPRQGLPVSSSWQSLCWWPAPRTALMFHRAPFRWCPRRSLRAVVRSCAWADPCAKRPPFDVRTRKVRRVDAEKNLLLGVRVLARWFRNANLLASARLICCREAECRACPTGQEEGQKVIRPYVLMTLDVRHSA